MHAAASSTAATGCFPVQFGENNIGGDTFGQGVAVTAVRAGNPITRTKVGADSRRHRFFADIEVDKTRHSTGFVLFLRGQFKLPDASHLFE
jgi:hypothetical protein